MGYRAGPRACGHVGRYIHRRSIIRGPGEYHYARRGKGPAIGGNQRPGASGRGLHGGIQGNRVRLEGFEVDGAHSGQRRVCGTGRPVAEVWGWGARGSLTEGMHSSSPAGEVAGLADHRSLWGSRNRDKSPSSSPGGGGWSAEVRDHERIVVAVREARGGGRREGARVGGLAGHSVHSSRSGYGRGRVGVA